MAKDKQLLQSELSLETQNDIDELLSYLSADKLKAKASEILRLAQKLKNNPEAIHQILTGRNRNMISLALTEMRHDPNSHEDWPLIILSAALPQTYVAMYPFTKGQILQWVCERNNPMLVKQLLSPLSEQGIIEFLNSDYFEPPYYSLYQHRELIKVLLEHFPVGRIAEVRNRATALFVYAALVKEDAAQAYKLIARISPQSRGIILSEVAYYIYSHVKEVNIFNNANSIIIKFMTAEDVTAAESGSTFSSFGLDILTEEAIKQGRGDLVNAILDQNILRAKPKFDLREHDFLDTIKHAARYGQTDILKTALACYAYYGENKVATYVNELARNQEIKKEIRALLTDYLSLDSPFRQEIELIKDLLQEGLSPNEALMRVKEAPTIALAVLTEDNVLIPELARIVADCLRPKKPVSLPSSSLNSSNSITTQLTQPVAYNEFVGDEGIPIDKPYRYISDIIILTSFTYPPYENFLDSINPKAFTWQSKATSTLSSSSLSSSSTISSSLNFSNNIPTQLTQPVADNEFVGDEGIPIDKPYVTEGIDILLPDVIPDSGYSSTTSSSTTTASQSTAGGTIRWADDEDIAAISHVKDDHKARKDSPKTSWQQRYEDSRGTTNSTAESSLVSSSHTHSERLAASSEQNVVTESASATAAIRDSGWRAKVNKGPTSFLKG